MAHDRGVRHGERTRHHLRVPHSLSTGLTPLVEYVYDALGRLDVVHQKLDALTGAAESTAPASWGYTYDAIGNRLAKSLTGSSPESWSYTYPQNLDGGNQPSMQQLDDLLAQLQYPVSHDADGNVGTIGAAVDLHYSPMNLSGKIGFPPQYAYPTYDGRGYLARLESSGTGLGDDRRPDLPAHDVLEGGDRHLVAQHGPRPGLVDERLIPRICLQLDAEVGAGDRQSGSSDTRTELSEPGGRLGTRRSGGRTTGRGRSDGPP